MADSRSVALFGHRSNHYELLVSTVHLMSSWKTDRWFVVDEATSTARE